MKKFPNGVVRLHTDGGGEYNFSDKLEIDHTETTPDTFQHNPFSERSNLAILDPVRTLLEEAGLPAKYWEYASHHVAFVKNRLPHSGINGISPYEKLFGKKPTLKHAKVFGCAAFVYEENPRSKGPCTSTTRYPVRHGR